MSLLTHGVYTVYLSSELKAFSLLEEELTPRTSFTHSWLSLQTKLLLHLLQLLHAPGNRIYQYTEGTHFQHQVFSTFDSSTWCLLHTLQLKCVTFLHSVHPVTTPNTLDEITTHTSLVYFTWLNTTPWHCDTVHAAYHLYFGYVYSLSLCFHIFSFDILNSSQHLSCQQSGLNHPHTFPVTGESYL